MFKNGEKHGGGIHFRADGSIISQGDFKRGRAPNDNSDVEEVKNPADDSKMRPVLDNSGFVFQVQNNLAAMNPN